MSSRSTAPARPRSTWRTATLTAITALLLPLAVSPAPTATGATPSRAVTTGVPQAVGAVVPLRIGKQMSSSSTLRAFLSWARAYGFRISEHPSYGGVTKGAHAKNSWHYDGLAADLNWGPAGAPASERANVRYAIKVADSMGLGVIYARDGVVGSAAQHRNHLHVDVGPTSNYGKGPVPVRAGSRKAQQLQAAVHFPVRDRDNLWGSATDRRLQAVRAASKFRGGTFPYGVTTAQLAVGVTADGKWGPRSRAAHDKTVAAIQRVLGVSATGTWYTATERAYLSLRAKLH